MLELQNRSAQIICLLFQRWPRTYVSLNCVADLFRTVATWQFDLVDWVWKALMILFWGLKILSLLLCWFARYWTIYVSQNYKQIWKESNELMKQQARSNRNTVCGEIWLFECMLLACLFLSLDLSIWNACNFLSGKITKHRKIIKT